MSTTLAALLTLGCEASLSGAEPQSATEYADRVVVHTGTRPNWTTLKAKRQELEAKAPVPFSISDRQFAQQLAVLGTITQDEAVGWASRGDLPAAIEAGIAALPEGDQFGARMLLSSATTYERGHPLVPALGGLLGYDAEAVDDLWRSAALL